LDRLSVEDKQEYKSLKERFAMRCFKNQRNKSTETFQEAMDDLKKFIVRGDASDASRSFACGVLWLADDRIAINIHHLSIVLSKCKSSINGSLQQMGYISNRTGSEVAADVIAVFPFMKNRFDLVRQWTVRTKNEVWDWEWSLVEESDEEEITPPPGGGDFEFSLGATDGVTLTTFDYNSVQDRARTESWTGHGKGFDSNDAVSAFLGNDWNLFDGDFHSE
jgi:hypothetical protein